MNRRSFLSSLAALSLPAVIADKVAEIAGYGCKVLCDWVYTGKPCGVDGCITCVEPTSYTITMASTGEKPVECIYSVTPKQYHALMASTPMGVTVSACPCDDPPNPFVVVRPCNVTPIT